ncbi:5537_t:CDS:2 [Ambispora gerdemannii]|uniref:5537_t:CDS:1 n=1 Tax=Ambispora gerdemannii TaxID=144530 RepID=A0A9N9C9U1_9GLOM|nr:5537_t:CDS:2 [Ambispora gerdemannii]
MSEFTEEIVEYSNNSSTTENIKGNCQYWVKDAPMDITKHCAITILHHKHGNTQENVKGNYQYWAKSAPMDITNRCANNHPKVTFEARQ